MSLSSRAVQAGRPRQQKMTIVILGGIFHDLGDETSWKKRSMNLNAKGNTLRLIGIFIGSQFSLHILSAVVSLDSVISGKIPNCWCFFQAAHSRKTGRLICPLGLVVDNSTTNNRSVNTHSCWNNVIHEWKLPFLTSQDLQLMMINLRSSFAFQRQILADLCTCPTWQWEQLIVSSVSTTILLAKNPPLFFDTSRCKKDVCTRS